MFEGVELAIAGARFADEKQAEDILVLDLRGISNIADYFVICTGTSIPHLKAIREEISRGLREEHRLRPSSFEGETGSKWVVLDYGDVIVHIFHRDLREFYALEDLWSDASCVGWHSAAVEAGSGAESE